MFNKIFIILFTIIIFCAVTLKSHEVSKIDHTTIISINKDGDFDVKFFVYWGKLIAFKYRKENIDTDNDNVISILEKDQFLITFLKKKILENIIIKADGKKLPLKLISYRLDLMGSDSYVAPYPFYIELHFKAKYKSLSQSRACKITFIDEIKIKKALLGNHMIRVLLKELKIYAPKHLISQQNKHAALGVDFRVIPAPACSSVHNWGGGKPPEVILAPFMIGIKKLESKNNISNKLMHNKDTEDEENSKINDMIQNWKDGKSSLWFLIVALFVAFWMGAGHALAPGHGKTMVAGYLIGTRGKIIDAVYLGIIVTLTHVSSVYLLSILMWIASDIFTQQRVFPWMTIISGSIIFILGMVMFARKNDHNHSHHHTHSHDDSHNHASHSNDDSHSHDSHNHDNSIHDHCQSNDHSHNHSSENKIHFKEILWLGISGGMVPCPSAMVVLLTSIALGVSGFGILLVTFFSLGLAIVLIFLGILVIVTKDFANKFDKQGRLLSILPKISGLFVTIIGVIIIIKGAQVAGFITINL